MSTTVNNIIDSSKLADLKSCPRKYFYRHILGWAPERVSMHLTVGTAWHEAMAILLRGMQEDKTYDQSLSLAIDAFDKVYDTIEDSPQTGNKTRANMHLALMQYVTQYRGDNFEVLEIEVPGVVPITSEHILHFKIDAIIKEADGTISILEHKTASSVNMAWEMRWYISTQVGAYLHFLNLYTPADSHNKCVRVNTVILAAPPRMKKDGTPYANAGEGNQFIRIPVVRSIDAMQSWLDNTIHWFDYLNHQTIMLSEDAENAPTMRAFPCNDTNCASYFGCTYLDFCVSRTNPLKDRVPPIGYKLEYWNPTEPCEYKDRDRIGKEVICTVCGKRKAPLGRDVSSAATSSYCNNWPGSECGGYYQDPKPDVLFPGESRIEE